MKVDGVQAFCRGHMLAEPVLCCLSSSTAVICQLVFNLYKPCSHSAGLRNTCVPAVVVMATRRKVTHYNEEARIAVISSTKLSSSVEDGTQGLTHSGDYRQVLYH